MTRTHWAFHHGVKYHHVDYSGFGEDHTGLVAEIRAAEQNLLAEAPDSVLELVDMRGTVGTKEVLKLLKASASKTQPKVKKSAVVGVTGIREVLLSAVNRISGRNMRSINDIEAAKDWLVAE